MDYIPENHSHIACVKLLTEAEADVNLSADDSFTPLRNAARHYHDDCIDLLVQSGANVNQPATDGITPIIGAAIFLSHKCLQKLISAEADVNAVRFKGMIALMETVWDSQEWLDEMIKEHPDIPRDCKQKECVEIFLAKKIVS